LRFGLDTDLAASGEALGEGHKTSLVAVDPHRAAQRLGVTHSRMICRVEAFGEGTATSSARDDSDVNDSDPATVTANQRRKSGANEPPKSSGRRAATASAGRAVAIVAWPVRPSSIRSRRLQPVRRRIPRLLADIHHGQRTVGGSTWGADQAS
jgi:hypothetical protein